MALQIQNYRQQPKDSKYISLFDVYVPALQLTLRQLKIMRKKDGTTFIAFPAFSEETNGEKKWIQYFSFSTEKANDFKNAVMKELKEGGLFSDTHESNS